MDHPKRSTMRRSRWVIAGAALLVVIGLGVWPMLGEGGGRGDGAATFPNVVVPAPVSAVASGGSPFVIDRDTEIVSDTPAVSDYLAKIVRTSTGYRLATTTTSRSNAIVLTVQGAPGKVGDEGYEMT